MISIEVPNPTNGAAYQVLFEAVQPAFCTTRDRQAEIKADFDKVTEWAKTQPPEVYGAYLWAIKEISKSIDQRMAANDLGNQVIAAYQSIPKPEV